MIFPVQSSMNLHQGCLLHPVFPSVRKANLTSRCTLAGSRVSFESNGRRCLLRLQNRRLAPRAVGGDASGEPKPELSLAPAKPKSPVGQLLGYYLKMEPHLFKAAVEAELQKLKEAREAEEEAKKNKPETTAAGTDKNELVLYKRVEELRKMEQRAKVEDLMYASVIEKFLELGVEMMPRLETYAPGASDLKALTEGIHSKEALDMVKEHVMAVMGPASNSYSNALLRMAKLQAAQVYAASILFGYFVRRVDKRFQLEWSLSSVGSPDSDAVANLERLFAQADSDDLDAAAPSTTSSSPREDKPFEPSLPGEMPGVPPMKKKSALRQYVESFDQATMLEIARLVSAEGAALVEMQTTALFGDVKQLQKQMQEAVGENVLSMEDLMQRVQDAVKNEKVDQVTVTVATQRRAVLEAVAFGTFLRDVEGWVDSEYHLLTPAPKLGGPGMPPPPTGMGAI